MFCNFFVHNKGNGTSLDHEKKNELQTTTRDFLIYDEFSYYNLYGLDAKFDLSRRKSSNRTNETSKKRSEQVWEKINNIYLYT